jgi:hypothetical protein
VSTQLQKVEREKRTKAEHQQQKETYKIVGNKSKRWEWGMGEWDTKPYCCTGQKNVRGKGGRVEACALDRTPPRIERGSRMNAQDHNNNNYSNYYPDSDDNVDVDDVDAKTIERLVYPSVSTPSALSHTRNNKRTTRTTATRREKKWESNKRKHAKEREWINAKTTGGTRDEYPEEASPDTSAGRWLLVKLVDVAARNIGWWL